MSANNLLNLVRQAGRRLDLSSLQFRLTAGVTALAILGLGSVALWASWKMQQILVGSHRQYVEDIADRFPQDIEFYSKTIPMPTGLQTAINNRTTPNLFLLVKRPDGKVIAQSSLLGQNNDVAATLTSLSGKPVETQVYQVGERYLMLYGRPLSLQESMNNTLYVAQDVTWDQTMFLTLVRSLGIATLLSILVMLLVMALYVQRSLRPLRQISQMTQLISADDLGQAQLQLGNLPSEVRELAQMFNLMLTRLSQAWEQQRQFVSNVSHELRTPLTIVQGYLQSTLRRSTNLTQTQREALEVATSEAERTVRLLQDLLNLARADSGFLYFHVEVFGLNELVSEVIGMARQFSDRVMAIEAGAVPIQVRADRDALKQVLINLIDNAVKYSAPDRPITLNIKQMDDWAIIEVCDRGYGIPLQQQTRIFERFYRGDIARTRATDSSGLGLSIVKTLVEGMGGSVTVRSKLGEGSTFTVTLPLEAAQ